MTESTINQWYSFYLGRTPTAAEIANILSMSVGRLDANVWTDWINSAAVMNEMFSYADNLYKTLLTSHRNATTEETSYFRGQVVNHGGWSKAVTEITAMITTENNIVAGILNMFVNLLGRVPTDSEYFEWYANGMSDAGTLYAGGLSELFNITFSDEIALTTAVRSWFPLEEPAADLLAYWKSRAASIGTDAAYLEFNPPATSPAPAPAIAESVPEQEPVPASDIEADESLEPAITSGGSVLFAQPDSAAQPVGADVDPVETTPPAAAVASKTGPKWLVPALGLALIYLAFGGRKRSY